MIAYRNWINGQTFYVANLPGDGGVDWGYTTKLDQAINLSPYWQRRFRKDAERCGAMAHFVPESTQGEDLP